MKTSAKYFHLVVGPRSGISSQKWPKTYLTSDITHKKKQNPTPKNFFLLQTQRLAKSFERFNSSLMQLSAEIFPRKNICKLLDFSLPERKVLSISECQQ